MTASTIVTIRQRILEEYGLGKIIANGFLDTIAAGSITSANELRNSNHGTNYYRGLNTVIYRPGAASSADYVRFAGDLTNSTGLLAHTGADYSDITVGSELAELWYHNIRPDLEVLDAINRALRRLYVPTVIPLAGLVTDGDMQASGTTAWTAATGATLSKATTAVRTQYGAQSLRVQNDSVDDYAQSSTVSVEQGETVFVAAVSSVDVGEAELVLYDVTNSVEFGTSVTHTEESPQYMWRQEAVPDTCKEMAVRLQGKTGASDDIYWSALWVYKVADGRIDLTDTFDQTFKIDSIAFGRYPNGTGNQRADARSLQLQEIPRNEWSPHMSQPEVSPQLIHIHRQWLTYPLFIQGRRPWSDVGTFTGTDETETTEADLDLLVSCAAEELFSVAEVRNRVPGGASLLAKASDRYSRLANQQTMEGPAKRKMDWVMPRARN